MLEVKNAMRDGEWVVCGNCFHKLGRMVGKKLPFGLEIKCHSCKALNIIDKPKKRPVKKIPQYKRPHCRDCENYKDLTGTCIVKLMSWGLKSSAKAGGSRECKSFLPRKEYEEHYKELLKK